MGIKRHLEHKINKLLTMFPVMAYHWTSAMQKINPVPVEIKLSSTIQRNKLRGLERFISDMKLDYGIVVNTASKIQQISKKIIQVPVHFL